MKNKILVGLSVLTPLVTFAAKPKPNIIYILADDLGYAELGCYGQQKIETPNIDALAAQGKRFTQHYSGTAVSAPSRCVLLTGKHTGHAYIRGNDEVASRGDVWSHEAMLKDSTLEGQLPVPASTITIPKLLKKAGYATACVGKWGLGYPGSVSTPNKMGFDFFYGYNCQRQSHTYYPPFLYRNERREYLTNKLVSPDTRLAKDADPYNTASYADFSQADYSPDLMFKELSNFVTEKKDTSFFLMWTTPVPHVSLQIPANDKWLKYYVNKFGDEKPYDGKNGYLPCRYPHATYAAMISHWDEQIGQLVAQLKALGLYENTLIIFTSDNGPTFNGGTDSPWFDSAKPYKSEVGWGKTSLREGGIRVPMIACWPAKIKAGTTTDHISAFWDVLPTFTQIAGIKYKDTDGISFLPTLLDKKQAQHEYLYWEYPEAGGSKAIRMGKWKGYIPTMRKGNKKMQLFDLSTDGREQNDVAAQHPDIIKLMETKMKEAHTDAEVKAFNF